MSLKPLVCEHGCCCIFDRDEIFGLVRGYMEHNEYSERKACKTVANIMLVSAIEEVAEMKGITNIEAKVFCDHHHHITAEVVRSRYKRGVNERHMNFGAVTKEAIKKVKKIVKK